LFEGTVIAHPYFRTTRRTQNPLIFSKIKNSPYNAVSLMYESGYVFHM